MGDKLTSDNILGNLGTYSGEMGSPMLSNFGFMTVSQFMEFRTIHEMEDNRFNHDFGDFDITKIPEELLKDQIKAELLANNTNVI